MNTKTAVAPNWATSSFGDPAHTSQMELSALGEHLDCCNGASGRFFLLWCRVEALHVFALPRLVSTLVVATLVLGVASLAL
jgi:hypothetical protein